MIVVSKARYVEAVQWQNTDQSLREIQDLIMPLSPYRSTSADLGVPMSVEDKYLTHKLDHVAPGGWVIKDGTRVLVCSDAVFKVAYSAPELIEPLPLDALQAASVPAVVIGGSAHDPVLDARD